MPPISRWHCCIYHFTFALFGIAGKYKNKKQKWHKNKRKQDRTPANTFTHYCRHSCVRILLGVLPQNACTIKLPLRFRRTFSVITTRAFICTFVPFVCAVSVVFYTLYKYIFLQLQKPNPLPLLNKQIKKKRRESIKIVFGQCLRRN